ncbi:MAG TPA: TerD family protein [Nocardioides sp.]|uniref:TerD family protein n=1 Tax=Nocardioides sp. TaxID=35761 RepID=UPI002F42501B
MIELQRGDEMPLAREDGAPLGRLTMGLGWDKKPGAGFMSGANTPDVDLDASAVQFAGEQLFDLAFFNHLETRDGAVRHLGDNISGRGEGDDEQISIDLATVYPRVDTMLFLVSSYQGHSLEFVRNAYCRLVDENDEELARFTLTEGVPRTGFMMAKMFRDPDNADGWRLRAIGQGIAVKVPTESLDVLQRFV